jgi:proteasome lid subunit RPN8/RPN11
MSTTTAGPDIRQLQERELPAGKFPGDGKSDFRVCIDADAHKQMHRHAKENVSVEICGVMVGRWGRDEHGPFLFVAASIPGEAATNKLAEVTFTHDTWSKINARMDKDFVGQSIVGWYHTHPDFGIFLSDRDRFIHEHFFNEPGQVALVIDPVREQEGVFVWSRGKAVTCSHYWVGDKIRLPNKQDDDGVDGHEKRTEKRGEKRGEKTAAAAAGGAGAGDRADAAAQDRPALGTATLVLGALCMLMLGWMLHERLGSAERQKLVEFMQVERVRLANDLMLAQQSLTEAARPLDSVVQRNPELMANPEVRASFMRAASGFTAAAEQLAAVRMRYGIDEREVAQLAALLTRQQAEMEARRKAQMPSTAPTTAAASGGGGAAAATTVPATQKAEVPR